MVSVKNLALIILFLPLVVASVPMLVAPYRRSGLPVAFVSVLAALTTLVASILLFVRFSARAPLGVAEGQSPCAGWRRADDARGGAEGVDLVAGNGPSWDARCWSSACQSTGRWSECGPTRTNGTGTADRSWPDWHEGRR